MASLPVAPSQARAAVGIVMYFALAFFILFLILVAMKRQDRIRELEYQACGIRRVFEDGSILVESNDAVRFACMKEHS